LPAEEPAVKPPSHAAATQTDAPQQQSEEVRKDTNDAGQQTEGDYDGEQSPRVQVVAVPVATKKKKKKHQVKEPPAEEENNPPSDEEKPARKKKKPVDEAKPKKKKKKKVDSEDEKSELMKSMRSINKQGTKIIKSDIVHSNSSPY